MQLVPCSSLLCVPCVFKVNVKTLLLVSRGRSEEGDHAPGSLILPFLGDLPWLLLLLLLLRPLLAHFEKKRLQRLAQEKGKVVQVLLKALMLGTRASSAKQSANNHGACLP